MTRFALAFTLLALAGCRDVARLHGTAVVVSVETGGLEVDQLRYGGSVDDVATFGPALRPETPGELLAATTSVRVLLSDALD
ncbi:MAG TPA: hypothetical protein VGE37_10020, partial [Archangium sp.]